MLITERQTNHREANESLSDKDFLLRIKISRKEAKETEFWLELLKEANNNMINDIDKLKQEANELRKILSAIINKRQ